MKLSPLLTFNYGRDTFEAHFIAELFGIAA
jgi:hypothetical protein